MTLIAEKPLTVEAFLALPDSVGFELIDGQLAERNVSLLSSRIAAQISRLLGNEAARTKEAAVYGADLSYQCFQSPRTIHRADVSLIRTSRLEAFDDLNVMPIPADLAVEVLSPNGHIHDVNKKVEMYLEAGFGLIWVVDPQIKIVYIHRPDGTVTKLHEGDDITGETALPSFRCAVAELFR